MRKLPVKNPPSRFSALTIEYLGGEAPSQSLEVFEDQTREILTKNDSPDVGFRYSLNPYRGCAHGCAYCYARPSHEYWGFGAGVDFERKIVVKSNAPELLRRVFERRGWAGDTVVFSGNTDCYQPLEATYELTRRCILLCVEYRNPIHIITKSALVERDLELIAELARMGSAGVTVSIPFWDERAARAVEPLVPSPARRVEVIRRLAAAGVPVSVNIAPLIPGLTDRDMTRILEAASAAGATGAGLVALRLPGSVAEVFVDRLREAFPLEAEKVLARIREMRGGELNDARFGKRMSGEGPYFAAIESLFANTVARLGLNQRVPRESSVTTFRRPVAPRAQLSLFET